MQITLEINTEFEPNDYQRRILLALAGESSAKALELVANEIQRQDDHWDHTHLAYDKGGKEAQGDAQQAHPELHRAFAEENAAAEAAREAAAAEEAYGDDESGEDTSGLPRHPDGRIVGRAPEGKKRRTKAQIAEDEAWEAAQSANEASDRAPVPDEEPEPPSAGGLIPQQAPPVAQSTTEEPEQATQPAPQEQEASSPWSW